MPRRSTVVLLAIGVALTAVACSSSSGASSATDPAPADAVDVGVEHVHGLGVDPADGTLYAATHFGLFRLPEQGEAERVADRYQDTMGFTVVGAGTFLGSGHPDFQKDPDLPTRLGLIRSADAGESWETVSLGGEADFHVLRAGHGNVYAWDAGSGRLMVSPDEGQSWETRGTLQIRDFVVDPANPDVLLATTDRGLSRSQDGGRTWRPVPDAPTLAVLAWSDSGTLAGVGPDGRVHSSADGGLRWAAGGAVDGAPEAMLVAAEDGRETMYVAVSPGTIVMSRDGGGSFTVRYRD